MNIYLKINKMTEQIIIQNIENYTQEIIDGQLILTPKKTYITENELIRTSLKNSKILTCQINKGEEIISRKINYRSVLIDIWKYMPSQKILQTTTFNIKLTNENGEKGYNWNDELGFSFQSKDANGTIKEILHMVKVNDLSIMIFIELETGRMIRFKQNI